MAQRTTPQETAKKDGLIVSVPMIASETIYKGTPTLVKAASGLAFSNDGTTNTIANGDFFAGISAETITNAGSAGEKSIRVETAGLFLLEFSDTLTQANLFDKVYVNNNSDDAVVTITSHASNPQVTIGYIAQFVSATKAYVSINNYVGNIAANGA